MSVYIRLPFILHFNLLLLNWLNPGGNLFPREPSSLKHEEDLTKPNLNQTCYHISFLKLNSVAFPTIILYRCFILTINPLSKSLSNPQTEVNT